MRLALLTCLQLPEPDPDEALLLDALAGHAVMLPWDDPVAAPARYDRCVLRSTWNYAQRYRDFLAWIDTVPRLSNPAPIVRWNAHKGYLRGLPVATVPTSWRRDCAWDDVVVKPAIGAGSWRVRRFQDRGEALAHYDLLARDGGVLVQPYVDGIETSVVWIDGAFTHAIEKRSRLDGDEESVSDACPVPPHLQSISERVLERIDDDLLYARFDFLGDQLSEVELIEPSLFLQQCPAALDRFAAALLRG